MRHVRLTWAVAATAVLLLATSPAALAGARRVGIYEATIRAISQTESWYGAIDVYERICGKHGSWSQPDRCDGRFHTSEQDVLTTRLADLPRFAFVSRANSVIRRNSSVKHNGLLITRGPNP